MELVVKDGKWKSAHTCVDCTNEHVNAFFGLYYNILCTNTCINGRGLNWRIAMLWYVLYNFLLSQSMSHDGMKMLPK